VAPLDVFGCGRAKPRWVRRVVVVHSSLNNMGRSCSSLIRPAGQPVLSNWTTTSPVHTDRTGPVLVVTCLLAGRASVHLGKSTVEPKRFNSGTRRSEQSADARLVLAVTCPPAGTWPVALSVRSDTSHDPSRSTTYADFTLYDLKHKGWPCRKGRCFWGKIPEGGTGRTTHFAKHAATAGLPGTRV